LNWATNVSSAALRQAFFSSIEFLVKPFYGEKSNEIEAQVWNRSDELICKVNGEWNGLLTYNYLINGIKKQIDTATLKVVRKRVRPLNQQEKYESRRVWLHVTNALRKNDLNSASRHKNQIEKQQRSSEKHRREQNIEFKPKSFLKLKQSGLDMSGFRTRMNKLLNSPGNELDNVSQHDDYDWFHKNWSL